MDVSFEKFVILDSNSCNVLEVIQNIARIDVKHLNI